MVRSASVEVGGAPEKGQGKVRRAYVQPDKLITAPAEGNITSMADVLDYVAKSESGWVS
jgi:long-chain acyl-CoA synthetase